MFCSSCGVAVAQNLSYCNYCGAKLNDDGHKSGELRPESLIFGILATFVFGIVAITIFMGVMKNVLGMQVSELLPFASVFLVLMLVLEAVFVGLLLLRSRGPKKPSTARLQEKTTKELDAAQSRLLPEPVPSVTEQTTRAFDYEVRTRSGSDAGN